MTTYNEFGLGKEYPVEGFATEDEAILAARVAQPQGAAPHLVPGVMRCAKCEFQLVRTNLYVNAGTVGPGNSKTEPCPNGHGPLWPVTWKQWAEEAQKTAERFFEEAKELRGELERLRASQPPRTDDIVHYPSLMAERMELLEQALVQCAFTMYRTPQFQLPEGVRFFSDYTVEVMVGDRMVSAQRRAPATKGAERPKITGEMIRQRATERGITDAEALKQLSAERSAPGESDGR